MIATDPIVVLNRQDTMNYDDLYNTAIRNMNFGSAGLTFTTVQVTVANTVNFLSKGVWASKTTASVAFTAGGIHDIIASLAGIQERCYAICCNAAGVLSIVAGTQATGAGTALLPERTAIADGLSIFGYVRIAIAAGAPGAGTNFVAGTTALNDARLVGAAATYVNLGFLAPRFDSAQ
jgi:hypothetical protein